MFEQYKKEIEPHKKQFKAKNGKLTDKEIEEFVEKEMEIEKKIGLNKARNLLLEAEKQLIKWGEKKAKENLPPEKFEEIKDIFIPKNYILVEEKLIDICLKMK